jgi:molybdenum-dependent DNA-binding transcriptional regulator ModE
MTMLRNGDDFRWVSTMEIDASESIQGDNGSTAAPSDLDTATATATASQSTTTRVPFKSNTRNVLEQYRAKKAILLEGKHRAKIYRAYSDSQLAQFIDLICEQNSIKVAAEKSGIALKSAYRYRQTWNECLSIPDPKRRGPKKSDTLSEVHLLHLIPLIDEFSAITLAEMKHSLMSKFPDLKVSDSSFYRFVRDKCSLSIKKLESVTEYRTLASTIERRKAVVQSWLEDPDMDFEKNCVFVDESGFNFHISRSRGWSKKGNTSKTNVPKARGNNISMIGAICNKGVINLSLRKPSTLSSKKRKADGTTIDVSTRVGTRTEHFLNYLENLLNILDACNLKGYYILMDNASIHTSNEVKDMITSRGYRYKYFPPYSPFLNAIELFWSKLKYGIKRKPFDNSGNLTPRIMESCSMITQQDCQGWIRNAISYLPRCLNEEVL